ncbi:Cytochrome c oxidase subunit VIIc family-containing protein [Strongyloides ratti]|uniref:Cytochrome c oxidase subunit VIIc family-containing protein n=1 Tax=Strongyloides ratti TaxID=34506 RepID=A0A090L9N2_STRRB|nr:Cytochrome c oxidase subunit VIIc family-containing protein [Strongyloides ratti]CEF66462.1 Cytochrome c oxidase subunit VIIc family-containing protein [Strongyloides ratti]
MVASKVFRPFIASMRKAHNSGSIVKSEGQTPMGPVHDGYAGARLPFSVTNKWAFAIKATLFLAVGFWTPFVAVEYQLRKANG